MSVTWWGDAGDTGGDPAFITKPGSWDILYFGSGASRVQMPGIVKVKAVKKRKVDDKNIPGNDGSTPSFLGYSSAQIDIYVRIWTRAQLDAFFDLMPNLAPFKSGPPPPFPAPPSLPQGSNGPNGVFQAPTSQQWAQYDAAFAAYNATLNKPRVGKKVQQPIDVDHPALQMLRVKALYVLDVTPFEPVSEKDPDQRVCILKCKEYSKSKQTTVLTPTGTSANIVSIPTAIHLQTPTAQAPETSPAVTEAGPAPSQYIFPILGF